MKTASTAVLMRHTRRLWMLITLDTTVEVRCFHCVQNQCACETSLAISEAELTHPSLVPSTQENLTRVVSMPCPWSKRTHAPASTVTVTATSPMLAALASRRGIQGGHGAWFQTSAKRPGEAGTPTPLRLSAHMCIVVEYSSIISGSK